MIHLRSSTLIKIKSSNSLLNCRLWYYLVVLSKNFLNYFVFLEFMFWTKSNDMLKKHAISTEYLAKVDHTLISGTKCQSIGFLWTKDILHKMVFSSFDYFCWFVLFCWMFLSFPFLFA